MYCMATPLKDAQSYYKDKIFPCEATREQRQYKYILNPSKASQVAA